MYKPKSAIERVMGQVAKGAPVTREFLLKHREAFRELLDLFPTLGWVPNVAQRRIVMPWAKPPYPFMVVSSCGNGTGKTDSIPQDIVGCLCGPQYLNGFWFRDPDTNEPFGGNKFQYYKDCAELREKGDFQYRLVCGPEDMKENGSLYMAIKKYVPYAEFKNKTNTGHYKQIEIKLPHNPKVSNFIDVKTFDQDISTHAGANLNRIAINEPPPFPVFAETLARIRSKKGEIQCTILVNATILDQATYLFELQDDPYFDGKIVYVQGSIWENCAGDEIPVEMVDEIEKRFGYRIPYDEKKKKYLTYGHLTKDSVENQIHVFERTDPTQIEARIWGANVQLFGNEFKGFAAAVHIRPTSMIPSTYPVIQVVDPHPVKPDLAAYAYIDPMFQIRWFEEWPHRPWHKLRSRDVTIEEICYQWKELEYRLGIHKNIVARIGDPNRFNTSDSRDLLKLSMRYSAFGFDFDLNVSDDMDYGHSLIHSALFYNKKIFEKNPVDPAAQPRMTFAENCENIIQSMKFYGRKATKDPLAPVSEQLDKTYKDAMDLVRYGVCWLENRSYRELMSMKRGEGYSDDYEQVLNSRGDDDFFDEWEIPEEKLKGRQFDMMLGR